MRCCMCWAEWVDCHVAALLAMTARVFAMTMRVFAVAESCLCKAEGRGSPLF